MEELALHILDLLENALAAGARQILITIEEDEDRDLLTIEVRDDGRGMGAETLQKALDPFYTTRTTRKVGLGLPLFQATAAQCGGNVTLESQPGQGTRVVATMKLSHPDLPPLGDMGATIAAALSREEPVELVYYHRRGPKEFHFSSAWLQLHLGEVPLNCGPVLDWVQRYINKGLAELYGGEGK
ncbi:Signal transduction histidine kinase, core [Moorella glycerini]|uniref:histidine kinase n=1 Tax=Neomoorella stamsii TaxID=1266720 RepID=A0A9X7J108_9FIRM|nr:MULTISPECIES: ATP-binding protein [Moorella]PRR71105.1 CAI-1 autoinducer sensor kinase/phosphatase CqsS [Moorella stamsii]CEP67939.1 Signal transduction histidine kinase, core [Moorella glycerini]